MADTHVYMVNDETGGTWECPPDYVAVAETRGWRQEERPVSLPPGLFDPGTGTGPVEVTGYDPSEHSVTEVNDYLATLVDSPGEVARILEAEEAGKARKTILEGPSLPDGDEPNPDVVA